MAISLLLYADDSREAVDARRALDEAGVKYACTSSPPRGQEGVRAPQFYTPDGVFSHLRQIQAWISVQQHRTLNGTCRFHHPR